MTTLHPFRMALLIRLNAYGTHADVVEIPEDSPVPPGTHLLRPGEAWMGIDYASWRAWTGKTADVMQLQFRHAVLDSATRPRHAFALLSDDDSWESEPSLDLKPLPTSDYGYYTGEDLVGCTREELIDHCARVPATPRIWTPEATTLLAPEEASFLVEGHRRHRLEKARRDTMLSLTALTALLGAFYLWLPEIGFRSTLVLIPGFAAIWLLSSLSEWYEARSGGAPAFSAARQRLRHITWVQTQPAVYTEWILGSLAVVWGVQLLAPGAIDAAGLVKSAVREGEWWRLLTGPMLHGGFLHFWMNAVALYALGRLVEVHARRECVSVVFLLSLVGGSLLSLEWVPDSTSVGASGGIMGLIGFLGVLGLARREALPPGFARGIAVGVLATALLGVIGHEVVDNAAHLGGFVTGGSLGVGLWWRGLLDGDSSRSSRLWGYAAMGAIVAIAAAAVLSIYGMVP